MKKEKSCGAIVYKIDDNKIYYLIEKHNGGHYSFPKGHVENNETEKETAIREIKEETNLEVELDTRFRKVSTYSPKEDVIKDVVFFVAKAISFDVKAQEEEISDIKWLDYADALKITTYSCDKNILTSANEYINNLLK